MNKYFTEYPNRKLYIMYNDAFCNINLILDKRDNIYYFVQFVYQIKNMLDGIKQVNKLKSNKSKLRKLVNECIDDFLADFIMHNVFEYVTTPCVLKDNKGLDVYIYICRNNNYYETFADNISIDRLKTKMPLLSSTF